MKTLICNTLLGIFLLCNLNSYAQQNYVFKNFIITDTKYILHTDTPDPAKDPFVTKRYTLLNQEGDSLFVFQELEFEVKNGEVSLYERGVTDRFVSLHKDSCYTFYYDTSSNRYGEWNKKKMNLEFILKRKDSILIRSTAENHIVFAHVHAGACKFDRHLSYYQPALDSLLNLVRSDNKKPGRSKDILYTDGRYLYPADRIRLSGNARKDVSKLVTNSIKAKQTVSVSKGL